MQQLAAPLWKTALDKALATYPKQTVVQLASLDPSASIPHVRSLVFREFMTTSDPSQPLILSTTDVRTPKTAQMIANPNVQIAWYIQGTQEQYRIAGKAHIVPAPGDLRKHFMHTISALGLASDYDWEAKRVEAFKKMSPQMKASWCRPVPGSKLEGGQDEAKKWPTELQEPKPGDAEAQRLWDLSLSNFALLIVNPTDVDFVELAPVPNRRTRFWRAADGWHEEALVP
ncbi:unnamed protein product [Mycena citricolor]|uniref:Pyridoxamine 5'-phosphate oxidase Alr4036 family FMN-binding domain-containing protein n=1 Tax=Mycena citricolor TaxID=2018698 RepID=A0AAD2HU05_9AGAR|nr:unnamed protein product [Mycena citricolor]